MVYVNAGDSKGQQGKVLKVDAQKQRAIVEGVNISKKATKPNAKNPQGGIIEQESAIHISNLQVDRSRRALIAPPGWRCGATPILAGRRFLPYSVW